MIASLDISGNIFVNSVISLSGGTRTPAIVPSVLPVNPCTQSRTTDVPPVPAAAAAALAVARILDEFVGAVVGAGALAVVTTSSSSCCEAEAWLLCREALLEVSGKARLLRRGGRLDPRSGLRNRLAILVVVGPIR